MGFFKNQLENGAQSDSSNSSTGSTGLMSLLLEQSLGSTNDFSVDADGFPKSLANFLKSFRRIEDNQSTIAHNGHHTSHNAVRPTNHGNGANQNTAVSQYAYTDPSIANEQERSSSYNIYPATATSQSPTQPNQPLPPASSILNSSFSPQIPKLYTTTMSPQMAQSVIDTLLDSRSYSNPTSSSHAVPTSSTAPIPGDMHSIVRELAPTNDQIQALKLFQEQQEKQKQIQKQQQQSKIPPGNTTSQGHVYKGFP